MQVRRATSADAPAVASVGKAFVDNSPYFGKAEVSEAAIERFLGIDSVAIFLAEDEGRVIGGCGIIGFPLWWADDTQLSQELFWWVAPEARGTSAAKDMLHAMEAWAKGEGAKYLFMVCLEDKNADRMARLYRRSGFEPVEHAFMRGI